jgi:hypothetical protein
MKSESNSLNRATLKQHWLDPATAVSTYYNYECGRSAANTLIINYLFVYIMMPGPSWSRAYFLLFYIKEDIG